MTHEERLKLLQTWYEKGVALEKASDEVCKVFDVGDLDRCAILAAAWGLWGAYTDAVAAAVGAECPGMDDWCTWWWWEAKHGTGTCDAKAAAWKKARLIRTVDDLCKLIEADLEQ
jgi:hypothetical protein